MRARMRVYAFLFAISDIYYTCIGKWKIAYNFQKYNKRNTKNRHVKYYVIGKTLSNIEVKYVYNLCYIFIFPILYTFVYWIGTNDILAR